MLFLRCERQGFASSQELIQLDQPGGKSIAGELPVALATGGTLGKDQVVALEAERDHAANFTRASLYLDMNESILPVGRSLAVSGPTPWA